MNNKLKKPYTLIPDEIIPWEKVKILIYKSKFNNCEKSCPIKVCLVLERKDFKRYDKALNNCIGKNKNDFTKVGIGMDMNNYLTLAEFEDNILRMKDAISRKVKYDLAIFDKKLSNEYASK